MSWWEYVTRVAATDSPKAMSQVTGIDSPSFSKWKAGQVPKADTVARFARAYRRPVVEAFVAAGFLTPAEARVRPAAAPDFTQLSNDELLRLVRSRMREEGEIGGDTAATSGTGSGPELRAVVDEAARDSKRAGSTSQARKAQDRAIDPPHDDPDDMDPR